MPVAPAPVSVDAVQVIDTEVGEVAVATMPVGTLGAVVSTGVGGGGVSGCASDPPHADNRNPAACITRTAASR